MADLADGVWLNPPATWSLDDGILDIVTDANTDFWRETHYGFTRDSGHFLGVPTAGDFTAQIRVRGSFAELYDQAGIMVRVAATGWVKAGIELSDGRAMLGSVLTDHRSDWTTAEYGHNAGDIWLRVTVAAGVMRLQSSHDCVRWPMMRLAPFPVADWYFVGPMCCSPERAGLRARFSDFAPGPPNGRALHDLG